MLHESWHLHQEVIPVSAVGKVTCPSLHEVLLKKKEGRVVFELAGQMLSQEQTSKLFFAMIAKATGPVAPKRIPTPLKMFAQKNTEFLSVRLSVSSGPRAP